MSKYRAMDAAAVALLICGAASFEVRAGDVSPWDHESRLVQAQPAPPVTTRRTVNLTEEDRHTIREIVLKEEAVERAPADIKVSIGDTVPENVKLSPFPEDVTRKVPQVKTSAFFVSDHQIVIVDPKDRNVAEIVK